MFFLFSTIRVHMAQAYSKQAGYVIDKWDLPSAVCVH